MTIVRALRAVLRAYSAEEGEEFRVAEQFGLPDAAIAATCPPRFEADAKPHPDRALA